MAAGDPRRRPALVREFRPDVLVTQHGCDTHALDPLAHLEMSVDGQRAAAEALHELAHEVCDGRWLALGGGGYAVLEVVPRTWSHLVAIAAHAPVEPVDSPYPRPGGSTSRRASAGPARPRMGDLSRGPSRPPSWRSWALGVDPGDPVDRAVLATRQAVFPLHGLDPWFS